MKISYRLLVVIALFITCLITANTIAVKIIGLGSFILPAAVLVFPLSYIIGDILTEVYGFRIARKVIWLGFACNLVFVFFVWIGGLMPSAGFWNGQAAYVSILGFTPRVMAASFAAYLAGEFLNAFVLSRMKVLTRGRWLWARTIGSTIIGQGLDTAVFIILAFAGTSSFVPMMIIYHWVAKVGIEVVLTPVTYVVVNYLKRKEGIDVFDSGTNFNPFMITEKG